MKRVTIIISFFLSLATIVIPILWGQYQKEYKELTIEELKRVNTNELYGKDFTLFINDSIKMNNGTIVEYKITNTGNSTLIGAGAQSDVLLPFNSIPIVGDSVYVKLESTKIAKLDSLKHLEFKQIRPQESIIVLCATANNTKNHLLEINDRDIKNTNIVYRDYSERVTTFDKISLQTKWSQVIAFMINILLLFIIVIMHITDVSYDIKTQKAKFFYIGYCIIWLLSSLYMCSLPIRWLL
jgi:hypothetical protein